ncbi:MAG: peptidylprolyl isomerase [Rhodothermia bacterium]
MWRSIIGIVLFGMSVTACGDPVVEAPEAPALPFRLGAPIADPGIAGIVISDGHADTLSSDRFSANIIRLNSMFPDVMSDPVQEASIRREIVKQFVVERLLMAEARRSGVGVDSANVARRFGEYRDSFASEEEFDTELGRLSQTKADLIDQFRIELTRSAVSDFVEQQIQEPPATEVEEFRVSLAERILAQHILFLIDETMTSQERSELKEKASAVLDSARSGVNFGDLARRHSDDIGTAQVGGKLPWFRRGEMVQGFEDAAFTLKTSGDVTENLVASTYGYHVIRLVSREKDEPVSVDSAKALLWRQQVRKAERKLIESLQANAEVRINPEMIPGI